MKNLFYLLGTILIVIAMLYFGKVFLIPFTLSVFFRLIMSYQVGGFQKYISYRRAIAVVITGYILLISGIFYALGASAGYLQENISSLVQQVEEVYSGYEENIKKNTFVTSDHINNRKEQGNNFLTLDIIGGIAGGTLSGLTTGLLIFVLSILLLLHEKRIEYTLKKIGDKAKDILDIARTTVAQYCFGLLIMISILFVLNTIGLLIFKVPYAPLIGGLSALATLVPTVGTIVGGIGAALVGGFLKGSLLVGVGILIRYLAIQQIEEYFIMPKVVGKRVSLNTLASIIALVMGGMLWGVAGLFLAIPIVGIIQKVLEKYNHPFAALISNKDINH